MGMDLLEQYIATGTKTVLFNAVDTDIAFTFIFRPIGSKTGVAAATVETDANGDIILKEDASTVLTADVSDSAYDTVTEVAAAANALEGWTCIMRTLPTDATYSSNPYILASQTAASCFNTQANILFDTSVRLAFSADITYLREGNLTKTDDLGIINQIDFLQVDATGTNPDYTIYEVEDDETVTTVWATTGFSSGTLTEVIGLQERPFKSAVSRKLVIKVTATSTLTAPTINARATSYRVNA